MSEAGDRGMEARAALLLRLRQAGIRDIRVLRAFETVPRECFAPHRFKDLAQRDIALPIGCGQVLEAPLPLARRLEALRLEPHHRVLEIGAGSGYCAAILSRLSREVVTIERFETLAIEARTRLASLAIDNADVLHGDGLAIAPSLGGFDRLALHMSFERLPEEVLATLAPDGVAILGRFELASDDGRPLERLRRVARAASGGFMETDLGACRLGKALEGMALAL